ncbi:MAG: DUF2147 domain-containing protein [Cyclobacteriaceae bacterium]|nr:DUF2147 domain-containing protein [Cyclobacteriaceae bacterium]MCH8516803.1 DUF2147 domain-containing protein [Cyclobacteriaceae bacterium]
MVVKSVLGFLLFLCVGFSVFAQDADAIKGEWLTSNEDAHIKIYKATNGKYYGKISWLKDPLDENGNPLKDNLNPDNSKREQEIMGLILLKGFEYTDDNFWDNGKIYDPEKGKEYSSNLKLKDANTLEVRGYIGVSFVGRTETWKRHQ